MKRKILSWLLMALLMAASMPGSALGANADEKTTPAPGAAISLEQAIQVVKQNLTIPAALTQFTSSFDSSTDRQRWRLNWSAQDDLTGNFGAEVDAATGEIVSLNRWSNTSNPTAKTPTLSVAAVRKIGQDLLNRLIPGKVGSLVLQEDNQLIPLGDYQSPSYNMSWKRQYQNIDVSMDGASMEIDMQTGEVISYNLNWTNKAFPDPSGVITSEKAQQVFVSEGILQMQYLLLPSQFLKRPVANTTPTTPQLIYGIRHPSNGIIDAFTAKPLLINNMYMNGGSGDKMANQSANLSTAPVPLTPEEQKEIDNVAKFITQADAIKAVQQWLTIPEGMKLESAGLEKNWQYPELRDWSLSWRLQSSDKEIYGGLSAQVDASTGELLSFSLNLPEAQNKNNYIAEQTARNLADAFIKNIQPQRWTQLKLDDLTTSLRPLEKNTSSYSFNYLRLVNGVLCPSDGINITVDASSQKIIQYSLNWSPATFPAASAALAKDQANAIFLKAVPLKLNYTMLPDVNGNEVVKLVYTPEFKDNVNMIDAVSGASLDSLGKPISENPHAYVFNDIKDCFAAKEIAILGQAGILGEYGDAFHPNEDISLSALLRAMLSSQEGVDSTRNLNDTEVLKRCQNLNWVPQDSPVPSNVSRELLAQLMVRYLKIDYLAQIQGIYQLPYNDVGQMPAALKGYAALTNGLGIIKADGKYFNPAHIITRGEAAVALVRTLSIKTQP
jgi:hypothetical protein